MRRKPRRPTALNGERGLIVAVMAQAYSDALLKEDRSALQYFRSQWYQQHLDLLDLPPHLIPPALRHLLAENDSQ